jgi:hypothetical protein
VAENKRKEPLLIASDSRFFKTECNRKRDSRAFSRHLSRCQPALSVFREGSLVTAFLIGTQNGSREELSCTKQNTSHFLIETEIALFVLADSLADLAPVGA